MSGFSLFLHEHDDLKALKFACRVLCNVGYCGILSLQERTRGWKMKRMVRVIDVVLESAFKMQVFSPGRFLLNEINGWWQHRPGGLL